MLLTNNFRPSLFFIEKFVEVVALYLMCSGTINKLYSKGCPLHIISRNWLQKGQWYYLVIFIVKNVDRQLQIVELLLLPANKRSVRYFLSKSEAVGENTSKCIVGLNEAHMRIYDVSATVRYFLGTAVNVSQSLAFWAWHFLWAVSSPIGGSVLRSLPHGQCGVGPL